MHLIRASTSRPKATLIRASALVPLGLESFEEDDTKNLRSDVYQADTPIIRAYSLASLLEYRKKNGLTPVIWDSLIQPNLSNHSMQPCAQGVKARLINLRWDAILSTGSVIAQLSDGSAHLPQSGRVNVTRVGFRRGGR